MVVVRLLCSYTTAKKQEDKLMTPRWWMTDYRDRGDHSFHSSFEVLLLLLFIVHGMIRRAGHTAALHTKEDNAGTEESSSLSLSPLLFAIFWNDGLNGRGSHSTNIVHPSEDPQMAKQGRTSRGTALRNLCLLVRLQHAIGTRVLSLTSREGAVGDGLSPYF